MDSSHKILEQRTIPVRAILRTAGGSYNGCRIYIPSANIPFTDPDFITFDTIQINFSSQNAWRYVLRSNITDGDVFYSFLGTVGGGQLSYGNAPVRGPQPINVLVKPSKPITYIEVFVNGILPTGGNTIGFTEMLPSATFAEGAGLWSMILTITFYKLKK